MNHMTILKKTMILTLLINMLVSGYASAESDESMINSQESYSEELTSDPLFIAYRGNLPSTIDQEWKNSVKYCWLNITGPSYYKFDESIKRVSTSNELLIVELSSDYQGEIHDSRIDEIYQKIEVYCEENCSLSDIPVVFMWADDGKDLVMVYDPDAFEKAKYSSNFVTSRGKVPTFSGENERLQWTDDVFDTRNVDGLKSYFAYYGGPLVSYSFQRYGGYIKVGVNKDTPEKVNDSSINEIYLIFNEHYEEVGIDDIPVVFVWEDIPNTDAEEEIGEPPLVEDDSENEISQDGNDSTQATPGFTSIMLVLCLMILIKYGK